VRFAGETWNKLIPIGEVWLFRIGWIASRENFRVVFVFSRL
jgi:hypothetical protein